MFGSLKSKRGPCLPFFLSSFGEPTSPEEGGIQGLKKRLGPRQTSCWIPPLSWGVAGPKEGPGEDGRAEVVVKVHIGVREVVGRGGSLLYPEGMTWDWRGAPHE